MIKIVAIGGRTSSGKSSLAIALARLFNGEIINADSRQVYQGMNIGTAKEIPDEILPDGTHIISEIPHHLVDILDPSEEFNLAKFQKLAHEKIKDIVGRGKLPIIVGGTGLYLDAVVYEYALNNEEIDKKKRAELLKLTVGQLQDRLKETASTAFAELNDSDRSNPHRLIRAIERAGSNTNNQQAQNPKYDILYLAIKLQDSEFAEKINRRVENMFTSGLVQENASLRELGHTTAFPAMKSIGYEEFDSYFKQEATEEETKDLIKLHTRQYAKRQMTWFKRNKDIVWITNTEEAKSAVQRFLDNR